MSLISHGTNRGAGAPLWRVFLLLAAAATAAVLVWPVRAQQQGNTEAELSPELVAQIEAIMAEKAQWTEAQQKVSSHLLQAQKIQRGEPIADGVVLRESPVDVEAGGMVTVDVRADVTPAVLERIEDLGGSVVNSVSQYDAIRADLPLAALEALAELDAVQSIRPADLAFTKGRAQRLEAVARTGGGDPATTRKVDVSEGDIAHLADQARRRYRVDGSGIGIGVLSDGVDSLAERQASGDLPAAVTVLPDQEGEGDEGTAMLEIVHDLAPGARLFFATALGGQAQFAANIEALCDAGADVIVDDIAYYVEPVFQDGIVAQGVNAAVGKGCFFFSAAGNNGNLNDGTSGVWEGDFRRGSPFRLGPLLGFTHLFTDTANLNRIMGSGDHYLLKWADPIGASASDYDLLLFSAPDSEGRRSVRAVSNDVQNGTQDPLEFIVGAAFLRLDAGNSLLILKSGGEDRFLHLNSNGGSLAFATDGQMFDHAAAANAIGVAATAVTRAGGPGGVFDGTESVELFSSDGPRRIFFHPDGRPITPGNFSSTGGRLLLKPDLTAADRVSTSTPGFEVFPGTSAAAPHAAAIAALMLEAAGGPSSMTRDELLQRMQDTALDIEAPGAWDRDSGAGIVDALAAADSAALRSFTDPVLSGGRAGMRSVHLAELRTRIDDARRRCGLSSFAWTDPDIVPGVTPVRAAHVTEPRAALEETYEACSYPPPHWTDPDLGPGSAVKGVHFTELRIAVRGIEAAHTR